MDAPRDERPPAMPGVGGGDGPAETAANPPPHAVPAPLVDDNETVTLPRPTAVLGEDTESGDGASSVGGAASEAVLLPPHTVVGRYIVLGHLGSGGMGVVYKAYDPDLNRQIALKLVRVAADDAADAAGMRGRLLREAQGLAQLSHPNVVAVYDVGLFEDGVFLAMELVAGPTLRAWLRTKPSYRDTLRVFVAVGEGLAAAHRAELVHRDVKPDNVILGEDGRPRVLDFGLVRAVGAGTAAASSAGSLSSDGGGTGDTSPGERAQAGERRAALAAVGPLTSRASLVSQVSRVSQSSLASHASVDSSAEASSSLGTGAGEGSDELGAPLTRAGAVLGTPRYMSPEQFLGRAADAKSDQFSFCVALYEGLYGQLPFRGKTLPILRDNICEGRVRPPPTGARVPAAIRRAILKGLATDPDQRYPSMAELLTELARDRAATRRRVGVVIAVGLLVGLAGIAFAQRGAGAARCQLDRTAMRALWSPAVEATIGSAFAATGRPYAADTATRVAAALAQRAAAWGAMQKASCEATWVHGTQSEALLDLRTQCLAQRRVEQRSLVALLSQPELDAGTVDRAVEAAAGLPAIADCADTAALRSSRLAPPPGAAPKVAAVREQLAAVRVRRLAGDYRTAVHDGEPLVAAAQALDYPPLLGEASYEYALALSGAGQFTAVRSVVERAIEAAAVGGDDRIAALAAAHWLWVVGFAADRANEALISLPVVRALAARVADDAAVQVALHLNIGNALLGTGDYAEAQTEYRRALELVTRAWGASDLRAAKLHNNLGLAAHYQGDQETAIVELTLARDVRRSVLGPEHPDVARAMSNLGLAQAQLERHDDALQSCREALQIMEAAHGPDHVDVTFALHCMARSLSALGKLDEAAAAAQRSLGIRGSRLSPSHAMVGESARTVADIDLLQGKNEQALELYRSAVPAFEPAHPNLVEALVGLGRGLAACGRAREALAPLERAVAFATEHELPSLADAESELARALWRTGDRERARTLAAKALEALEAAGRRRDYQALADWLAAAR